MTMPNYFDGVNSKPAIRSTQQLITEDSRPDLMREHYRLIRNKILTKEKVESIENTYNQWFDLLFSNFNIVVQGPQSKFILLETFKTRYLDLKRVPNWRESNKSKTNSREITTARLHGLDPIKLETFTHALFKNGSNSLSRRQTQEDIKSFVDIAKKSHKHYVFLIHSIDYFLRDSEDVSDLIIQLITELPEQIHLLASSDIINSSKKLSGLRFKMRLIYSQAPYTESFSYEHAQLVSAFDIGTAIDQTIFSERVDLQSLKDVHQALGNTGEIMLFILKDYVEKHEAAFCDGSENKDENDENQLVGRKSRRGAGEDIRKANKKEDKQPTTDLDFQFLLRHCESNFIVRRATALRQHLGELRDHNVISLDETGNKIRCLVDVKTCKKFIEYVETNAT